MQKALFSLKLLLGNMLSSIAIRINLARRRFRTRIVNMYFESSKASRRPCARHAKQVIMS